MISTLLSAMVLTSAVAAGPWDDLPAGGTPFRTFFVTWTNNGSPEMFEHLRKARPQVVQIGFYGPMFHGYAHHPKSTGYPMQLPVAGEQAALERQAAINRQVHELLPGVKVIGHFQLCNVVENPDEPFGFMKWYNVFWDPQIMGAKPVEDVRELLQRDAAGKIIKGGGYIDFIGICLSSPHTQAMLKKMVEVAIAAGCDGIQSNYNYRWACACPYCQKEFKDYLRGRYDPAALRDKFGIENLDAHTFPEIPARIPGYVDPAKGNVEFQLAAMDWGTRHFKKVFDQIYIEHGRSIKPDFIVGTWNHLGTVGHSEERALLPIDLWGKGEDYFWYSGSHAGKPLADHIAGDAWLNLLWMREMARGKPVMVGKYEQVRLRVALAEAAALGGAGTGLYHPFMEPAGSEVLTRYTTFIREHDDLYSGARPYAEVGLILPRQNVLAGKPEPMDIFRKAGQALAEAQILFDVVSDERLSDDRIARHRVLVVCQDQSFTPEQQAILDRFTAAGGRVLTVNNAAELEPLSSDASLSNIGGAWTLRASAMDLPVRRLLHLVNYNRDEAAGKNVRGPAGEMPIAERDITIQLRVPRPIAAVQLWSPDLETKSLEFTQQDDRVRLTVPEVTSYVIVDLHLREAAGQ